MSDVVRVAAAALLAALCAVVVRKQVPELAILLAVCGGGLILLYCSGALEATVELLDRPSYLTERHATHRRPPVRRLAAFDRAITPALESSYASFLLRVLEETEGLSFLPRFLVEEPVRRGLLSVVEVSDLQAVMYEQIFYHREKWATREMEAFVDFCAMEEPAGPQE